MSQSSPKQVVARRALSPPMMPRQIFSAIQIQRAQDGSCIYNSWLAARGRPKQLVDVEVQAPRLMLAQLVDVEVVAARLPLGTTDAWACVATVLMKRPMAPP